MNFPSFEIELKLLQQRSEARVAISFAALQLRNELAFLLSRWRMNEREAVVHAKYLEQFDQFLMPRFGERRNGGEGLLSTDPDRFPPVSKRFVLSCDRTNTL